MAEELRDLLQLYREKKIGPEGMKTFIRDQMIQTSGWSFANIAGGYNGQGYLASILFYTNIDDKNIHQDAITKMTEALIATQISGFQFANPSLVPVVDNKPVVRQISFGHKNKPAASVPKDKKLKELRYKVTDDDMMPKAIDFDNDLIVYLLSIQVTGNYPTMDHVDPNEVEVAQGAVISKKQ